MKHWLSIVALFCCGGALAAAPSITIGTFDLPPHSIEATTEASFSRELFLEVFHSQGWDVKLEFYPWARTFELGKQGKVDAVWPSIFQKERETWYTFGHAVLNSNYVLLKRKSLELSYTKLADAKPYSIGVLRGGITGSLLDRASDFHTVEATSFSQNIQKLAAGRLDFMTCDRYNGQHLLLQDFPELAPKVELVLPPISTIEYYLMFSKLAPELEAKESAFKKGLQLARSNGKLKALLKKFGYAEQAFP